MVARNQKPLTQPVSIPILSLYSEGKTHYQSGVQFVFFNLSNLTYDYGEKETQMKKAHVHANSGNDITLVEQSGVP